jgi:hypothetical protein
MQVILLPWSLMIELLNIMLQSNYHHLILKAKNNIKI